MKITERYQRDPRTKIIRALRAIQEGSANTPVTRHMIKTLIRGGYIDRINASGAPVISPFGSAFLETYDAAASIRASKTSQRVPEKRSSLLEDFVSRLAVRSGKIKRHKGAL